MKKRNPPGPAPEAAPSPVGPTVEIVPIGDLIADAGNVRVRDERAKKNLADSVRRFGPARSVVLDGRGIVRAGNGTVDAAVEAGVSEVLVVRPAPGQLVAVKRDDWSPTEATAYGVQDNRAGELATWDNHGLAETVRALESEGIDPAAVGFSGDEISAIIEGLGSAIIEQGEWAARAAPDKHSIVVSYRDEDVSAILDFLGETDPKSLTAGKAGSRILERIREVAASRANQG